MTRVKSTKLNDQSRVPKHEFEFKDITQLATTPTVSNDKTYELIKVEEYTMEFLEMTCANITKLIIFLRPFDDIYFGNLANSKNIDVRTLQKYSVNSLFNLLTSPVLIYRFYLGNEILKRRYVEQFIDIFTEHGRKSTKITVQIRNEKPKIKYNLAAESFIKQKLMIKNESTTSSANQQTTTPVQPTQTTPVSKPANQSETTATANLNSLLLKNNVIKISNGQGSYNHFIIKSNISQCFKLLNLTL